jgi:hypothetical protein
VPHSCCEQAQVEQLVAHIRQHISSSTLLQAHMRERNSYCQSYSAGYLQSADLSSNSVAILHKACGIWHQ